MVEMRFDFAAVPVVQIPRLDYIPGQLIEVLYRDDTIAVG
jgi:hypothetical protein